MAGLKAFHFDVTITGTALVYAASREDALDILRDSKVMCAGNKMYDTSITMIAYDGNDNYRKE
jgi:hypothetical protein